ncbi:MAG: hypothetical protein HC905_14885 [Bacteroidales bacterium]|nr:hypothetical protein [Bacteroidales bacterium]
MGFIKPFSKPTLPKTWAWCSIDNKLSDDAMLAFFERYRSAGVTGILSSGSNELYQRASTLARRSGVELHAWRWTLNRGQYIKTHPNWYAVNRKGESCAGENPPYVDYYRWLCPSRDEVKEVIARDYETLCDIPDLPGVHLDYVRYCDIYLPKELQPKYNLVQDHEMPEFDYCYCTECRRLFKEENGTDPLEIKDPAADKAWHEFRLNQVVKLVNHIVESVHKKGKIITGAVFPTPAMSRTMVRQNWAKFNLDAYMPMVYQNLYGEPVEWIGNCIKESIAELPAGTPVYAGIFRGAVKEDELQKIHRMVKQKGGAGLSFFTAESLADADLNIIRSF